MRTAAIRSGILVYGLGAVALGLGGVATGDFAFAWPGAPGWVLPAFGSGVALIFAGVLVLRAPPWPLRGVAAIYAFWALTLHAPRVVIYPESLATWWALAETATLAAVGLLLAKPEQGEGSDPTGFAGSALGVAAAGSAILHLLAFAADPQDMGGWLALTIPLALATAARARRAEGAPLRLPIFAAHRSPGRRSHAL